MKADLQDLARANPVTIEAGESWAMTAEGESARRRALDGETEIADHVSDRRSPRIRWPAAVVSGVLVLVLAVPALFFLGDEAPQTTTTTLPATTTSVTEDTVPVGEEPFYTAVLGCVADQTGNDFGPVTVDEDGSLTARGRGALDGAASGYPGPYQECFEEATGLSGSLVNQTFALFEGEASIPLPDGWISTTDDLTPNVGDPEERITISTYPAAAGGDTCAQVPVQALDDLDPNDLFLQVLERSGPASATRRPPTFAGLIGQIDEGTDLWECMSSDQRSDLGSLQFLDFEHEGRQFYVLLALGSETGEDDLHLVELILDSIVIRPEIAAGWTFTEIPFTIREGSGYALGDGWLFAWGGSPDRSDGLVSEGIMVNVDSGEWRKVPAPPIDTRYLPSVVWTGNEFIVFGGRYTDSYLDGAAYDPATGTWRLIEPAPFDPAGRPAALWIDDRMVVWLGGEDSEINEMPQPAIGQLASYNPSTNSWATLEHPDVRIVDAVLRTDESGRLSLVGGPNMRDVGVVGGSGPLYTTTYDSSAESWSAPVIDSISTESARVFESSIGLAVLRDDGEIHGLSETAWETLAAFGDSCWYDVGATSGGGSSYLRFCGGSYQLDGTAIVPILGADEYGATSSTWASAFLATADGRLVVMGESDVDGIASGIVVFGVYEPEG